VRAVSVLVICLGVLAQVPSGAAPHRSISKESACARLKKVVAKLDGIPESGPVGMGWFCDFSTYQEGTTYVIALRSNRKCDGPCSNLMGWYAVDWADGSIHDFDVADMKVGVIIGASHSSQ
jgi:hypothetical protein